MSLPVIAAAAAIPPLSQSPPRKVSLLVEPTPFTHVSGYSNRFKEMLRYLQQAGDDAEVFFFFFSLTRPIVPHMSEPILPISHL